MYFKKITALMAALIIIGAAAMAYLYRHDIDRGLEKATLPEEMPYSAPLATQAPSASSLPTALPVITSDATPSSLPNEINLSVPFTAQAPHANWDLPYKEFCEEASVLMAVRYVQNRPIASAEDADQALLAIKQFEEDEIGQYLDTTIAETARIITEFYELEKVEIVTEPTALDIRQALADGKPVIVPAAGRQLGNPYYQTPGPLYHMLVIKGYTKDNKFIVNDPGTRRGADFVYDESTIMNAMHDWRTDQDINRGAKVILIVG